ncbi:Crotonobetainyl-CoA:carnitine CoA-transferase CaiB [Lentibacillus persicus]|uniref:Crotonobetainyl-CoA:carnitine CoA-transferase CaiB n=1 Tax=Lentibacillus persicus TaxID=640948 RepID=A0A1I1SDC4_9BACI|nr:CoA transferase [Lentibacillus persicus]SFD44524.1 Crotonobetainyl-CoA:carnitine CoA-transferase CaiB [Lentibacillus persicus]
MPLKSIRVLDLSRLLPGPYCTMLLADFGAEVIKVEEPAKGDYARAYEPKLDEDSAMFHSLNRNKKSVCLDLKSENGKNEFLKMAESADVIVESFRPGVMERLGLDYATLKRINPRLVYCAITGYGQTGPFADKPGHDINYLSFAGLLNLMGDQKGKPVVPATQIADIGGGALLGTIGILLALLEREKSGEGQFVDVSMLDGVIAWLQTLLPDYLNAEAEPKRGKEMLNGGRACYSVYETKDERYLSVGALEPKFWEKFCQVIGRHDFVPLLEAPLHEQHRMKYEIQLIISQKTLAEWLNLFSDVEACVSPVLTFEEMIEHPQVIAREMIQSVNHSTQGTIKHIGIPIKLSETPGKIYSRAPKLGEHTDERQKNLN